jgi:hypothetical protein
VLEFWKGGEDPRDDEAKGKTPFSAENYGDDYITHKIETGKVQKQRVRRATLFVPTIEKFSEDYWCDLIKNAREYLVESRSKRQRAISSSSAGPAADEATVYDPDAALVMEFSE